MTESCWTRANAVGNRMPHLLLFVHFLESNKQRQESLRKGTKIHVSCTGKALTLRLIAGHCTFLCTSLL